MKLKILLVDISAIPDNWDIEKWFSYITCIRGLPVKDLHAIKEMEVDITLWQWIKYKLGFKDIFNL